MTSNHRDLALYGAIGGLTAAQAFIMSGDLPHWCAPPVGISLAILIAVKAKLSKDDTVQPVINSIKVVGRQ